MCDLNWCPVCDKAISCHSESLYCSIECHLKDTNHHINLHDQCALRTCCSVSKSCHSVFKCTCHTNKHSEYCLLPRSTTPLTTTTITTNYGIQTTF